MRAMIRSGISYCDRHGHELMWLTDGYIGYVASSTGIETTMWKDGNLISVDCPEVLHPSGYECDGRIEWDMYDADWHPASQEQLTIILEHGREVES